MAVNLFEKVHDCRTSHRWPHRSFPLLHPFSSGMTDVGASVDRGGAGGVGAGSGPGRGLGGKGDGGATGDGGRGLGEGLERGQQYL